MYGGNGLIIRYYDYAEVVGDMLMYRAEMDVALIHPKT